MDTTDGKAEVEGETEEIVVYMDFNMNIEDGCFSNDKDFKIVGLDSEEPILQLGPQVFQGEWRDSIGTYLFFEETRESSQVDDPLFSESVDKNLRYCFKTDKLLHMSRIFVKPKGVNQMDSPSEEGTFDQKDVAAPESPK